MQSSRDFPGGQDASGPETSGWIPGSRLLGSCGVALLVSVAVLVVALERGLPLLGGAALYLLLAIESDLRIRRIPNWLNLSAFVVFLGLAGATAGAAGLILAALGALGGFLLGFPLFALGALGAGDAKGLIVLGAALGLPALPALCFWIFLSGAVFSIALLAKGGELAAFLSRWGETLHHLLVFRRWVHTPAPVGTVAASGIPFAICMGVGCGAQALWGLPW